MPTTQFDPRKDIDEVEVLKGEFTKVAVRQEPHAPGHIGNTIIDPKLPFNIDLEWQFGGELGEVNAVLNAVGNNQPSTKAWHIYVYAEKMGRGEDKQIYYTKTPDNSIVPVPNLPAKWKHTCVIPGGTLEEHDPGSGMYRLCIVVFADTSIPGCEDIVGWYEGPMIMAESPH
jgi:hypothetical protein